MMKNKRIDISECEYINGFCYKVGMLCKDVAFCNIRRMQQLKAENEKLKNQVDKYKEQTDVELRLINDALETSMNSYKECSDRYKQCLDEIEKRLKAVSYLDTQTTRILKMDIENIIKQAKEGGE